IASPPRVLRRTGPAAEEVDSLYVHDDFVVLIEHFTARADDASIGPTARQLGFEHGESPMQGIARSDWFEPAQVVDAWRAETVAVANHRIDEQAHVPGRRVPATGNQSAINRLARRIRIGVHRLRVVLARKVDDALGGELDVAQIDGQPLEEIFKVTPRHRYQVNVSHTQLNRREQSPTRSWLRIRLM